MRKTIGRGVAVTLTAAGLCWGAYQVKGLPVAGAVRLARAVFGESPKVDVPSEPAVVSLSPAQMRALDELWPESEVRLPDIITPEQRAKELELIDLSRLSATLSPTRPTPEEKANDPDIEVVLEPTPAGEGRVTSRVTEEWRLRAAVKKDAETMGPETSEATLVEANPKGATYMPPCTDEAPPAVSIMPYADEAQPAEQWLLPWTSLTAPAGGKGAGAVHRDEPPLCQEDPSLPFQYPGCPAPGKATPPESREAKPKAEAAPDQEARKRPLKWHHTFKPAPAADENPKHPEVDTMECRPGDAGRGAEGVFPPKGLY